MTRIIEALRGTTLDDVLGCILLFGGGYALLWALPIIEAVVVP